MKNKNKFMGLLVAIVISFVADVSPCFGQPVPGGPGYFIQPGSAFRPRVSTASFTIYGSTLVSINAPVIYYAPVFLPHGATINKLVLYYSDTDATLNIEANLYRVPLPWSAMSELAIIQSSGSSTTKIYSETTTINNPVVDNQGYGYYVRLYLPASDHLGVDGFRIDYSFPTNLPVILK